MSPRLWPPLAIGAMALTVACSTSSVPLHARDVQPRSYTASPSAVERSVGKLHHLLVLPVQLDASPENERLCPTPCPWSEFSAQLEHEASTYLAEARGYRVLRLADAWAPAITSPGAVEQVVELLSSAADARSETLPGRDRRILEEFARGTRADGIMLLRASAHAMTVIDWVLMYASFSLSTPISAIRTRVRIEASVFEISRGRLVWVSRHRSFSGLFHAHQPAHSIVHRLLDPIEPALPRAMWADEGVPGRAP